MAVEPQKCMLRRLFSAPESWRKIMSASCAILNRLRPGTTTEYISEVYSRVCQRDCAVGLQVLCIHAFVYLPEFRHSIFPLCDEALFIAGTPYLHAQCLLFARLPVVRGMERIVQTRWLEPIAEAFLSQDLATLILAGANDEYSEFFTRESIIDMGEFDGLEGGYPSPQEILLLENRDTGFSASALVREGSTIESRIVGRIRPLMMDSSKAIVNLIYPATVPQSASAVAAIIHCTGFHMYTWFEERGAQILLASNKTPLFVRSARRAFTRLLFEKPPGHPSFRAAPIEEPEVAVVSPANSCASASASDEEDDEYYEEEEEE
ncbi:MAG: hypothetical protein OK454_10410, partial [Thaumarchaeota archaeon]|nr:hypothetical protein [Nitrososphaerota archaeon]